MKALRICRICEQFPPNQGGLSRGMFELSNAQHERGHHVTVIAPAGKNDIEFDNETPFTTIRIPANRIAVFGWKAYKILKSLSVRLDIVHTHGPGAYSYAMLKRKSDPPLVHSVHTVRRYQYGLYKKILKSNNIAQYPSSSNYEALSSLYIFREYLLEMLIFTKADHLALVADYFRQEIKKHYKIQNERMTTVYNGSSFQADLDEPDLNKTLGKHGDETKTVIFVGRFDWHKRIDLLIRSFARVIKKKPNTQLVLIGDGDTRIQLEALTESLGLTKRVLFTGWAEKKALVDYYRMAACICLPSLSEGLPKVLLEAMSMGVPIISAENLAASELLRKGEYGFLVKESTPEAWSAAIDKVLERGIDVEANVRGATSLLSSTYRWNHVAERLDTAYEKVLKIKEE